MSPEDLFNLDFCTLDALIAAHGATQPRHTALAQNDEGLDYGGLNARLDRIAAALQRDGVGKGGVAAICATTSIAYATAFLGTLRAGAAVAPLAPSSTPESLADMLADCGAGIVFLDAGVAQLLAPVADRITARRVSLDGSPAGQPLEDWLAPAGRLPTPVEIGPGDPFNIIYSSGTTGTPKGIVQPHGMRWSQFRRVVFDRDSVTLVSTPLYSNTTLVSFLPTLAVGGTAVLMAKFDAAAFLALAARHRATHAMLVPVQYRRIMARPDFDTYDLSSFRLKFSTSAPFAAELKADVLKRWPGGLVEYYGMTEGGGTCMLLAHEYPGKLHTVGRPVPGHDIRLIDDEGREVPPGEAGEVVGRSAAMMAGYHNQPDKTRAAEWLSPEGFRYIRTGDVGRFDADGFLTLLDRKKDMIISGGFNIYPSDLEAELAAHPAVLESAVLGVPSEAWGETPVAYVVVRPEATVEAEALKAFANARLGKTQRLADVLIVDSLPRSAIGKILKRELREAYGAGGAR
ncbi:4-coumarate--CoA ligase [Oleomonas cavernae]|uniref:4-coumarate--CoA ligase n=1 Tax=Oleomonas cavernae TaxID=2320859 RepID=A0A418WU60_9PROT|nr:class I adenylate-forming enzyme family protein [Oleomonas cavernae]RJF94747.1 4-coumarate--CoA ligase [Oleomonas cavernae]